MLKRFISILRTKKVQALLSLGLVNFLVGSPVLLSEIQVEEVPFISPRVKVVDAKQKEWGAYRKVEVDTHQRWFKGIRLEDRYIESYLPVKTLYIHPIYEGPPDSSFQESLIATQQKLEQGGAWVVFLDSLLAPQTSLSFDESFDYTGWALQRIDYVALLKISFEKDMFYQELKLYDVKKQRLALHSFIQSKLDLYYSTALQVAQEIHQFAFKNPGAPSGIYVFQTKDKRGLQAYAPQGFLYPTFPSQGKECLQAYLTYFSSHIICLKEGETPIDPILVDVLPVRQRHVKAIEELVSLTRSYKEYGHIKYEELSPTQTGLVALGKPEKLKNSNLYTQSVEEVNFYAHTVNQKTWQDWLIERITRITQDPMRAQDILEKKVLPELSFLEDIAYFEKSDVSQSPKERLYSILPLTELDLLSHARSALFKSRARQEHLLAFSGPKKSTVRDDHIPLGLWVVQCDINSQYSVIRLSEGLGHYNLTWSPNGRFLSGIRRSEENGNEMNNRVKDEIFYYDRIRKKLIVFQGQAGLGVPFWNKLGTHLYFVSQYEGKRYLSEVSVYTGFRKRYEMSDEGLHSPLWVDVDPKEGF